MGLELNDNYEAFDDDHDVLVGLIAVAVVRGAIGAVAFLVGSLFALTAACHWRKSGYYKKCRPPRGVAGVSSSRFLSKASYLDNVLRSKGQPGWWMNG